MTDLNDIKAFHAKLDAQNVPAKGRMLWMYPCKIPIEADNLWLVWLFWNETQYCDELDY